MKKKKKKKLKKNNKKKYQVWRRKCDKSNCRDAEIKPCMFKNE